MRADEVAAFGPRYSPLLHWLGPLTFGLCVVAYAIATLDRVQGAEWLAIPSTFLFANASEWRIHRDLLHRKSPLFPWLYERHTLMHHRVFVEWDFEVRRRSEWGLVLIPPAAVVLLVASLVPPALALAWLTTPDVARLFLIVSALYILSYEALHLAYHLPADSVVGRLAIVRFLRRHHAAHHHPVRMSTLNFNVTFPIWDQVRRTVAPPEPAARRPSEPPVHTGSTIP
jgi:sterol desaturase/sphingolipid hydroxylase (fatty acid hydroxylase superfamily)